MGQVGDPCDLSWLVFDLSQLGAMMKIHPEHWENTFAERYKGEKKEFYLTDICMQHAAVWILLLIRHV